MVVVLATDHRWVRILAPLVYLASVAGLVLVLTMGTHRSTARGRGCMLGGLSIQPSEFAKLAVVIGMALSSPSAPRAAGAARVGSSSTSSAMLADRRRAGRADPAPARPRHDAGALGHRLRRARRRPGRPRRWLAAARRRRRHRRARPRSPPGCLKDYQVDRFLAFTNPDLDPRGAGYNVEQARIAVGNGGLFGQGLFDGSQTRSGLRARAAHRLRLHGRRRGARPGRRRRADRAARRRDLAGAADRRPHRRRVRPGRRGRHRLLVRLPGLPEHRHVPGDHAGHRRPAAVRVVRRQLDVRRHARGRAAAEHPPALDRDRAQPVRRAPTRAAASVAAAASGLDRQEDERRQQDQVHARPAAAWPGRGRR